MALAVVARLPTVVFQASVTGLIPLDDAIGVFLSFTRPRPAWPALAESGRVAEGQEINERGAMLHYEPALGNGDDRERIWGGGTVVALVFAVIKSATGRGWS